MGLSDTSAVGIVFIECAVLAAWWLPTITWGPPSEHHQLTRARYRLPQILKSLCMTIGKVGAHPAQRPADASGAVKPC